MAGELFRLIRQFFATLLLSLIRRLAGGRDVVHSLLVDGHVRAYAVHLPPAYDGQSLLPMVLVLHGGGANAQNAMRMTGMNEKANREQFIVVYPEGTSRADEYLLTWNAGEGYCCGYAEENGIDDVKFVREMLASIQQEYSVDMQRIFATGFSNGGMMAYRLGCEMSDTLAAIGPVSGALGVENCQPERPLPVIIFHGTADQHVLYEGGTPVDNAPGEGDRVDPPVAHAVQFWVQHNLCSPIPQREENGNILRELYMGGREGTEVLLYTVKGGGHAWPGGRKGSPEGDEPTQEISATDLMWEFFISHPRTA